MAAETNALVTISEGSSRSSSTLGILASWRAPRYFAAGLALVSALFASPALATDHAAAAQQTHSASASGSTNARTAQRARQASQRLRRQHLKRFTPAAPEAGYTGRPIETLMNLSDAAKSRMTPAERRYLIQSVGLRRAALSTDHVQRLESLGEWTNQVAIESLPEHVRDQGGTGTCYAQAHFNMLQNAHARQTGQHLKLQIASHNLPSLMTRFNALLSETGNPDHALNVTSLGEGGYFHWSDAIAEEFGVVPETDVDGRPIWTSNENTTDTTALISTLRQYVVDADHEIRALSPTLTVKERAKQITRIRRGVREAGRALLHDALGTPPKTFVYNGRRYTPRQFFHSLNVRGSDYVTLMNSTAEGMAYNKRYSVPAWLGQPAGYFYNTSMDNMMRGAKDTIDAGDAVWIATKYGPEDLYITPTRVDGRYPRAATGLASFDAFNYSALGLPEPDSRREYEQSGERSANHALAMTAYKASSDPKRIFEVARIDNSWNRDVGQVSHGDEGHWQWDHSFFTRGGVELVVVRKSVLTGQLAARVARDDARDAAVKQAMREVIKQHGRE